jgi:hypothetical protein
MHTPPAPPSSSNPGPFFGHSYPPSLKLVCHGSLLASTLATTLATILAKIPGESEHKPRAICLPLHPMQLIDEGVPG